MTDDQHIAPSSLAAALLTVGGMVLMILASVVLFGEGAEDGPLQVAMTLGLTLALAVAMASGNSAEDLSGVMRKSIDSALGTVFVLLAVGALFGVIFSSSRSELLAWVWVVGMVIMASLVIRRRTAVAVPGLTAAAAVAVLQAGHGDL